ncbi:MAG: GWxTD domain-containing protein [Bacteroidia bacterium]|nr:GWxTD domain-containing protein [Bacteroidia bacterium]MDW8417118.1 GWxTD domain-containing protein [Bacteroidia bacterium]
MKQAVHYLLIVLGANYAQPLWIERAKEHQEPAPFRAQVYHIGTQEWVLFIHVDMEPWLPYAFDTVLTAKLQVFTEKGLFAETLLTLPAINRWNGFLRGRFSESLSGQMTAIYLSSVDAPHEAYCTRAYWTSSRTTAWIEAESEILRPPIRVWNSDGQNWVIQPRDSLWGEFFTPASVDTSIPLPPYVLRSPKRARPPVQMNCAWYLKGDTTRIFWTCDERRPFYPCPGASFEAPPAEMWREAYLRFSDRKPGERTDRGMIYLFYGPPNLRILSPKREIWVYPEENISFHFVWENGGWRLVRRLEYQSLWKRK